MVTKTLTTAAGKNDAANNITQNTKDGDSKSPSLAEKKEPSRGWNQKSISPMNIQVQTLTTYGLIHEF